MTTASHPFDRVVVGVDGSASSERALAWAAERLPPTGRLHVVHGVAPHDELALASFHTDRSAAHAEAEKHLQAEWVAAARSAGVDPLVTILDDDPADAILRVVEDHDATVAVVGSHGAGLAPHLLGSVTRKLVHNATVPVIIAPETDATPAPEPFILGCVGHGPASDAATAWAADLAAARSLPLVLAHVLRFRPLFPVDSPMDMLASYLGGDVPEEWAASDLEEITEQLRHRHPDLEVSIEVTKGRVVPNLLELAEGAEIVVIGRGRTEPVTRNLIGSLTRQIATRSSAPTAIVPPCETTP